MRIVLLIDSLTSGGAQRQFCELAKLLSECNYEVTILTYYEHDFFMHSLTKDPTIAVVNLSWNSQLDRFIKVTRFLHSRRPDVVVSFLFIPGFLAELSKIVLFAPFKLIVSERNNDTLSPNAIVWIRLLMHVVADQVVANSNAQASYIRKYAPWLRRKISVITNCLSLNEFRPRDGEKKGCDDDVYRLVIIARYEAQKNGLAIIEGLSLCLRNRNLGKKIIIDWYGNDPNPSSGLFEDMKRRAVELGLVGKLRLMGPVKDVASVYGQYDGVCSLSTHEGCSNVVCEAMACGIPVVATRVGDNSFLLGEDGNAVLVNDSSAASIANGFLCFSKLSRVEISRMGKGLRGRAEYLLGQDRFINEWKGFIG